jgi:hypothetical protein
LLNQKFRGYPLGVDGFFVTGSCIIIIIIIISINIIISTPLNCGAGAIVFFCDEELTVQ